MKKNPEVTELIESIGGYQRIAYEMGVSAQTSFLWQKNGIPIKYWKRILYAYPKLSLARLAKAHV